MPAAITMFTPKELLEVLVKAAGVHEGSWRLALQFNVVPLGPGLAVGAIVPLTAIGIERVPDDPAATSTVLIVDAGEINSTIETPKK